MKRLKRIISIFLTFVIIATLGTSTAFADPGKNKGGNFIPPGLAKKDKLPYGIAKKLFDDSDIVEWAQKAIEKLGAKGLVKGWEGKFFPQNSVTKLESVVMALRILGFEKEACTIDNLPKQYKGGKVQDWAVGYVTLAYERGILDDVDMMYWNPTEPVKRFEVGKYVIRALGYEKEAQKHMDAVLNYKDADFIPQGAVGYVYLLKEFGLMQGDGVSFNPLGTLTRAEMAVLFNSLNEKVDNSLDDDEYEGEVYKVYEDKIVIRVDGKNVTIEVDEDVIVYDGNRKIRYRDIEAGSNVIVYVDDGKAIYIEVTEDDDNDKIFESYIGQILEIDSDDFMVIVQVQSQKMTFAVLDSVDVYFMEDEGEFEEIKKNDIVKLTVDRRNRVKSIYVYREKDVVKETEIVGYITNLDLVGVYHISIDNTRYLLSPDADVKIKNKLSELSDLDVGMKAKVTIKNNEVVSIVAEEVLTEVEGIIEFASKNSIKVVIGDQTKEFQLGNAVIIDIEDYTDNISNLKKGMKVELKLSNGLVTYIYAKDNVYEIDAEIKTIIKTSNGITLHLQSSGKPYILSVSSSVKIKIDGIRNPNMEDLKVGQKGKFEVINESIVEINISK